MGPKVSWICGFFFGICRGWHLPTIQRKQLYDTLAQQLQEEMEGTCTGRYGFIVTTMYPKPEHISDGVVDPATGFAHYDIKFSAIICRPFKGEVIDAIVTTVNKMGFFAEAGPLQIFVSNKVRMRPAV
jgi:DNA-directed RNA polymerase II subunit RPB7